MGFEAAVKAALRRRLRAERDALDEAERASADAAVTMMVTGLAAYKNCAVIACYKSFGSEVSSQALIEDAWAYGKKVALPRTDPTTSRLRWFSVDSFDGLERGSWGIEEPPLNPNCEVTLDVQTLLVVPGLSFDRQGYRLGYGGGYYDRVLASFPGVSVGLCRSGQLREEALPHEAYDLPVSLVVTDQEIIRPENIQRPAE